MKNNVIDPRIFKSNPYVIKIQNKSSSVASRVNIFDTGLYTVYDKSIPYVPGIDGFKKDIRQSNKFSKDGSLTVSDTLIISGDKEGVAYGDMIIGLLDGPITVGWTMIKIIGDVSLPDNMSISILRRDPDGNRYTNTIPIGNELINDKHFDISDIFVVDAMTDMSVHNVPGSCEVVIALYPVSNELAYELYAKQGVGNLTNENTDNNTGITSENKWYLQQIIAEHTYSNTQSALAQLLFNTSLQTPKEEFTGNVKVMRLYLDNLEKQRLNLIY